MMKHLWICLFALLPFLAHAQEANEGVSAGDRMPSFNIVHDDGTTVTSASFKGKVILVNFFATWCPPCQKELAEIQQTLWPKYKDNPDFALLVIGREHSDADLQDFSPTHTSAKTAYAIAEGLGGDVLLESDITYKMPEKPIEIPDDELTVVAVPVYGGRVAETAMERLRVFHAHHAPVVPVVVYGNRDYEDALLELTDALTEAGFVPVAAGAFVGEHSFSRKQMPIAAGRPDAEDHEYAVCFGVRIRAKLETLKTLADLPPLKVKGNFPYREKGPSTPQAPVVDEELCTQCEYCIDVCPVSAISIVDDRMFSDPNSCIKCCACVKECPEGARSFDTPYTAMLHKNFSARREPELFV